jgi:hypothetical protein
VDLHKHKAELERELAAVNKGIADSKSRKMVQCAACGKRSRVSGVDYIQTLYYERPYGCTGGDRWHEGEGCFLCPKCGVRNRLLGGHPGFRGNEDNYHKTHPYTYLKPYFREVIRQADSDRNFVNHYIAKSGKVTPGANFSSVDEFPG